MQPIRWFALATVVIALAGCDGEAPWQGADGDSAAVASAATEARTDTLSLTAAESLIAVPDHARAASPSVDTASATASPAELEELAAQIIVPVAGVQPGDLRDTYAESRGSRPHDAIDIPANRRTAVISAADGRLLKLHNSIPGGLMVYAADASDRFILMYGHLDGYAPGLEEGMRLRQGQLLGYVGTTGNAPPGTPHLHFSIARGRPSVSWWRGTAANPYPLLVRSRP